MDERPVEDGLRCPGCDREGRVVSRATLEALLTKDAHARLRDDDARFRFCGSRRCAVVYYGQAVAPRFGVDDLSVPVFQKSDDPDRLVCHCFEHTVRGVEREVARTGGSDVPRSITASCRAGLDDCVRRNPQGRCCLGNVRALIEAARSHATSQRHPKSASVDDSPTGERCASCDSAHVALGRSTPEEEDR